MDFLKLPETTEWLVEALTSFVEKEVIARSVSNDNVLSDSALVYGADGAYTAEVLRHRREIRVASAAQGFFQACIPENLGGGGEGAVTWFALWECLFRKLGPHYMSVMYDIIGHWATGPSQIFKHASEAVRTTAFAQMMSGEKSMCFAMSEPDAGADIWNMKSRAVRDGAGWRVNGVKQWISNGPYADFALVFAVTDRDKVRDRSGGISAFLVPTSDPGFSVLSVIKTFGHAGGHEGILSFDDVFVADEFVVGHPDAGLEVGFEGLALGRLYNAARGVGLARWALELGREHSLVRSTFGKPILEHQAISFMIAESAVDILSTHLLALHAAHLVDNGTGGLLVTSSAKMDALESAGRVIDRMIQVHGGMGVTNEVGLVEAWNLVRVSRIADGSDQILRRMIARGVARNQLSL